jgi:class 3 adenylate cyclase
MFSLRAYIRQDIGLRIHDLVGTAAIQIDVDAHNAVRTRADERGEQYAAIKRQLQRIRARSTGVRFVYTMRRERPGSVVFVVDAEEDSRAMSHVGDPYGRATPVLLETFETPEELAEHLRPYFKGMTTTVLRNHGTIDKYIGDAIMAFWGAPHPLEGHAVLACRAALQCQQYLLTLNKEWSEKGIPVLKTRIGLNTGEVIVGNFGYEDRLNYTVMGDNVNLASRMEAINKYYGTGILISENTYARVADSFETRRIDVVVMKGKTQGVAVHELVAEKGDLSDVGKELLDLFNAGSDLYLGRQWDKASALFEETLRRRPDDTPSQILLRRCQECLRNPPPEDWTGAVDQAFIQPVG